MSDSALLAFAAIDPALARRGRVLSLRGHERAVRIGVHDFERQAPQRLLFDVDVCVALEVAHASDDHIAATFDYDAIRDLIGELVQGPHVQLQETLCDLIVQRLLQHEAVLALRVRTRKPDVYPDCDWVGVERVVIRPPAGGREPC